MLRSVAPTTRRLVSTAKGLDYSADTIIAQTRSQITYTLRHSIDSTSCSQVRTLHTRIRKSSIPYNTTIRFLLRDQRCFSSSTRSDSNAFHAVTGYAFAGKPRTQKAEEEMQQQFTGTSSNSSTASQKSSDKATSKPAPRQGFPLDTLIGKWVDATLREGEAGEDAVLFEKMKGQGDVVFGVSDGVGGWSEEGIDPALFSQSLMYHSAQYAKTFYACPERLDTEEQQEEVATTTTSGGAPIEILEYAYGKTLQQKEVPAGSATACILTFDASKGILRAANLGDSGFLILRPVIGSEEAHDIGHLSTTAVKLSVHHQSKPQVFGFNAPYQLSKLPIEYRSDNQIDCTPQKADLWKDRVMDGDLVLVATDGFWDNVSVSEVLQLVQFIKDKHRAASVDKMLDISHNPLAEEEDLATVLAHNLLSYALMCQFSTNKKSPFEREAARHGIRYPGGKVDDVAIIVSLIVER